jgi:hypothetical protein
LKKAATLLRDGLPAAFNGADKVRREVFHGDPNCLDRVATSSIDLAVIAPAQPGFFEHGMHSWLRTWWLGVDLPEALSKKQGIGEWRDSNNEMLVEMARTVKSGGRAVLRAGQGRIGAHSVNYRQEFEEIVNSCLSRFWRVEGSISERYVDNAKARSDRSAVALSDLIVLRRK